MQGRRRQSPRRALGPRRAELVVMERELRASATRERRRKLDAVAPRRARRLGLCRVGHGGRYDTMLVSQVHLLFAGGGVSKRDMNRSKYRNFLWHQLSCFASKDPTGPTAMTDQQMRIECEATGLLTSGRGAKAR